MTPVPDFDSTLKRPAHTSTPIPCAVCGAEHCRFAPDPEDDLGPLHVTSELWLLNAAVIGQVMDLARLVSQQDTVQSADEDRRLRRHIGHAEAHLVEAVLIRERVRAAHATRP